MPKDFSGKDFRGHSFQGQSLAGANFSNADIRGANFAGANLRGANFTGAQAGLQKRWAFFLLMISCLLSGFSGFLFLFNGVLILMIFDSSNIENKFAGWVALIVTIIIFAIIRQGIGAVVVAFAIVGAIAIAFAVSGGAFSFAAALPLAGSLAVSAAFAGGGTAAIAAAFTAAVAIAFSFAAAIAFAAALAGAIAAAVVAVSTFAGALPFAATVLAAFTTTIISTYITWRTIRGDEKYTLLRNIAIASAEFGGTSFYSANLTDADFTRASLKNIDLRKAKLTRTCFYETKQLDFARVGNSILSNRDVLNLLVTGNGRKKSYVGLNLKGANLIGADLKEANLKDADITEATFGGACLEWANLTLTQAIGTDFSNALMTGACVEAWNIESTTKLDNIDCRFVYLLENPKPRTDDRERRPSSGEFQSGEFTKLFEEVLNTVDLIFRDGIDWKAFVTALKKVQVENEDTELAIQTIENKGDGVVVVKVAVPVDADKEKIHNDFTHNYQLELQAVEEKYKAQLQAQNEQIIIYRQQSAQMQEIVSLLANKPINIYNNQENTNMTNSNDSSRKIEIGSVGRDFNASGQALNLGDISGTVTNTINELPASPEPGNPGIKELLTRLQTAIQKSEDLTAKNKEKALKQVKSLAEASKNPQDEEKQDLADTAITMLQGLISGLPSAATLIEACNNLLPQISKLLGIG